MRVQPRPCTAAMIVVSTTVPTKPHRSQLDQLMRVLLAVARSRAPRRAEAADADGDLTGAAALLVAEEPPRSDLERLAGPIEGSSHARMVGPVQAVAAEELDARVEGVAAQALRIAL